MDREIARLKSILENRSLQLQIIKEELLEARKKYGDERRTEILDAQGDLSMEDLIAERIQILGPYKITEEMMSLTGKPGTIFLHCLPAFHNLDTEVSLQANAKAELYKFLKNKMSVLARTPSIWPTKGWVT